MKRPAAFRARPALGVLAALAVGGLALGACGIPSDPSASPISASQFQSHLHSTPPPVNPCNGCVPVDVYFVAPTGGLAPVNRVVPPHAKIGSVIGALLDGTTAQEHANGTVSALGPGIRLLSATETNRKRTVSLNFNAKFGQLSGTQEVLGVAQVVYTISAFTATPLRPDVGVTFETVGSTIEVPVESGALSDKAVRVTQYAALLTHKATSTPTAP